MSFITDLKKPAIMLTVILAIIGWAFTLYLYQQSKRTQRPVYAINSDIIKVYDSSKKSPNLVLLKSPQEEITKDVFLVIIHFWNAGTAPIEPQDIRTPVKFTIPNCEEIVDYDVAAQTSPDTTRFSLSYGNDKKSLLLDWSHLDPNNGARFNVFYTGPPEPKFLFTGNILGKTSFPEATFSKWIRNNYLLYTFGDEYQAEILLVTFWIGSILLIIIATNFPQFIFKLPSLPRGFRLFCGIFGGALLFMSIIQTFFLFVFSNTPPV